MGFDNYKQKVVDVFHQKKETTIDSKDDAKDKLPDEMLKSNVALKDAKEVATESVERVSTVARKVPKKTVQVIDGITARVKH